MYLKVLNCTCQIDWQYLDEAVLLVLGGCYQTPKCHHSESRMSERCVININNNNNNDK